MVQKSEVKVKKEMRVYNIFVSWYPQQVSKYLRIIVMSVCWDGSDLRSVGLAHNLILVPHVLSVNGGLCYPALAVHCLGFIDAVSCT